MAATRTYNDVWNAVRLQYSKSLEPSAQQEAMNMGIAKVWRAWDWKGSVSDLPPFWLVPGLQDYNNVPTDYLGLREAYLIQPNDGVPSFEPLKTIHNLGTTDREGCPEAIGFLDKSGYFRLDVTAAGGYCAPNFMVGGTYKRQPAKVLLANLMTVTPWDDQYFDVVVAGFAWAALLCSGQRQSALEADAVFRTILFEALTEAGREKGPEYPHPAESVMGD